MRENGRNESILPVKKEGRKPLFANTGRKQVELSGSNRMVDELRRMNDLLLTVIQNQQKMDVYDVLIDFIIESYNKIREVNK